MDSDILVNGYLAGKELVILLFIRLVMAAPILAGKGGGYPGLSAGQLLFDCPGSAEELTGL